MKKFFAMMVLFMFTSFIFVSCGDDDEEEPAKVTEYTIKYDANGGTGTIANTVYKAGDQVTLSDGSGFSRDGYAFMGWSNTPDGTNLDVNAINGKDVTLYAVWQKVEVDPNPNPNPNPEPEPVAEFTIKYDANGGTGTIASTTYKAGEQLTISDGTGFTREGYTFKGWSTSADGTSFDESAISGKDITLYAVWEQELLPEPLVTITLDLDGGAFVSAALPTSFSVITGTVITADNEKLAALVPAKDGFTFKGWATEKGGAVLTTSYTVDKDATIYAVWEKNAEPEPEPGPEPLTVTVTLDLDGGALAAGLPTSVTVNAGTEIKADNEQLKAFVPTKEGYIFKGWATEKGGAALTSFTADKDATIYAIWEKEAAPEPTAYFPKAYKAADVVAWYSATVKDGDVTTIDAIFLYNDGSVFTTKSVIAADGSATNTLTAEIEVMGMKMGLVYSLASGDYVNGTLNVGVPLAPAYTQAPIKDGVLTLSIANYMDNAKFTKQDNKNIPTPSK